jgi:hypothetical protein
MKMNEKVDIAVDAFSKKLEPILEWKDKFQNIWVWSIVSGVIIGFTAFGIKALTDKYTAKDQQGEVGIADLRASPVRRK